MVQINDANFRSFCGSRSTNFGFDWSNESKGEQNPEMVWEQGDESEPMIDLLVRETESGARNKAKCDWRRGDGGIIPPLKSCAGKLDPALTFSPEHQLDKNKKSLVLSSRS